jgi:5-formyltetrahydrofolate cyclo-ligase
VIGVAYAVQEFPEVPHEPHDRRLDVIVTEAECIRVGSS